MILNASIPRKRLSLLKNFLNNFLEKFQGVKIEIKNNLVFLEGEDVMKVYKAYYSIVAFGRGFSLEDSLLLSNDGYTLEIISLESFTKSKNRRIVLKGRVIGEGGKAKRLIEKYTNTKISVFGKTIGIIGLEKNVIIAKNAILMLLEGRKHSFVYRYLEENIRNISL